VARSFRRRWCASYLLAAVIGGILETRLRGFAVVLPAVALALVVVMAFFRFRDAPARQNQTKHSSFRENLR
jgi:uncharacterized membrane protein YoaK (UPF0700 family)